VITENIIIYQICNYIWSFLTILHYFILQKQKKVYSMKNTFYDYCHATFLQEFELQRVLVTAKIPSLNVKVFNLISVFAEY
jgi:hypothetical protein